MIRHGDIMLRPISQPEDIAADDATASSVVLAEGEKTGHSHVLHGATLSIHRSRWAPIVVHVPEGAELRHQEHKTITVPPGWYQVVRQRVYTPVGPVTVRD